MLGRKAVAHALGLSALVLSTSALAQEAEPLAQENVPRRLTIALAVSAGMTFDSRACTLAARDSPMPDSPTCVLFTAGGDVAFLWRSRIGGALGLYSVSGQAARTGQDAAIPDRISIPMVLEVRPLAFLPRIQGYAGRALAGLTLRLGPSVEIVRTARDSAAGLGVHSALFTEVPLSSSFHNGVSLRVGLHVLSAPKISLNNGDARSAPFSTCTPQNPEPGCLPASERNHGYGPVAQMTVGLVYYP